MIYLDHNASNLPDPRLLELMITVLRESPANPGSPHTPGRRARRRIEQAREQLAEGLEIIESQWIHQKRLIPPAQLQ